MIVFNKHIKEELRRLEIILDQIECPNDAYLLIGYFYEQISNKPEMNYEATYDLGEILQAKTIKYIEKVLTPKDAVVLEIIKYKKAPNGYLIIYNEFNDSRQTKLEIFKEREKGLEQENLQKSN